MKCDAYEYEKTVEGKVIRKSGRGLCGGRQSENDKAGEIERRENNNSSYYDQNSE